MTTANAETALQLTVDADSGIASMNRMIASFKSADGAIAGMSRAATGLNQVIELGKKAWAAFGAVAIDTVKAFADESTEINRVRIALERSGVSYAAAEESLSNYVDERAKLTMFDDSAVRKQLIDLANASAGLGATADDLMEWSTLAQDVGESLGDMEQGLALVTAAAGGKITALAKAIPAQREYLRTLAGIPDAATRADRALEFLGDNFGGQSTDLDANSLAWNRFSESIDDAKESLGQLIAENPAIRLAFFVLTKALNLAGDAMSVLNSQVNAIIGPFLKFRDTSTEAAREQRQLGAAVDVVSESVTRQARAYDSLLSAQMSALTGGQTAQAFGEFSDDLNAAFADSLRSRRPVVDWVNNQLDFMDVDPANLEFAISELQNSFQDLSLRDLMESNGTMTREFFDQLGGGYRITADLTKVLDDMTTEIDGQEVSWRTAIGVYLEAQQAQQATESTTRASTRSLRDNTDAAAENAAAVGRSTADIIASYATETAERQTYLRELEAHNAYLVGSKLKRAQIEAAIAAQGDQTLTTTAERARVEALTTADVYSAASGEISGAITAMFQPQEKGIKPFNRIVGMMLRTIGLLASTAAGVYLAMPGMQGFGIALTAAAAVTFGAAAALGASGGGNQTRNGNVSTIDNSQRTTTNIYIQAENSTGRPVASAESFAAAHRQAKRLGYVR
jgi:hypothetical protein